MKSIDIASSVALILTVVELTSLTDDAANVVETVRSSERRRSWRAPRR